MKQLISILTICLLLQTAALAATATVENATTTKTLRGYTRSSKTAVISSEFSGKIIALNYDVGDLIGDKPLITIDTTFINLDIQRNDAAVRKIETEIIKSTSRIAYLTKEFKRKEQLVKKGRTSEVLFDAAKQELDQAILIEQSLKLEKENLKIIRQQLLEQKKRYRITPPKQWIITDLMVEKGEIIQPGKSIAVINNYQTLVVPLALSSEELSGLEQQSEAINGTLNGQPITATVRYINPEFNEKTRKTDIELSIAGYKGYKRGGLQLLLPITIQSNGLKVPKNAVEFRYNNPKVYLATDGSAIPVSILDTAETHVIITQHPKLPVGTKLKLLRD